MEWTDEGIVIGVRRHAEASAIVDILTLERGRHRGLVRGATSRRLAPLLQAGNTLHVTWRARLDQQLGTFAIEPLRLRADRLMRHAHGAYGATHMASLIHLLAEREPHPGLFRVSEAILDALDDVSAAAVLLVRFEIAILSDLGFGLELDRCAATGERDDLAYVSPRTGRAVSRAAGAPYADRLLPLPAFLLANQMTPQGAEVEDAFRLTAFFLERHVMKPRGLVLSDARAAFLSLWTRQRQK